jgi:hypothetical protein
LVLAVRKRRSVPTKPAKRLSPRIFR